ncbi:MAG: N-acetylornithine carbamoyltransferase [Phycisphaerales bacterium]|nr:N-acetylornithine carbamoyltransferase [Phycisphaerales bacterium]
MPKHFITTQGWTRDELQTLIDEACALRLAPIQPLLAGKTVALLFFNPSLRTRTSFEVGAWQLGGHAVVLEPGKAAWPIAFDDGARMDGIEEEHVREVARVLSRYCDIIAVRCFPKFVDWTIDRQDRVVRAFARHATVPVINMETIEHPCQELAHIMALQQRLGGLQGRKYVLTWTYHPKPLNTAVANSAAMIATKFGMDVTLLCPSEDYRLDERYMQAAADNAHASGGSFRVSHDINASYDGAEIVYAKSWGALPYFGRWEEEKPIRDAHRHFIVDEAKMARTAKAVFSHCLPARRNIKATDAVMDAPTSLVVDEAENRLHVQKALLAHLVGAHAAPLLEAVH